MARRTSRPPIAIVAIIISLPLFPYTWHKVLHIFGAVLFIGNMIVTAAWMTWAARRKEPALVAFVASGVNKADQWFTSPGSILLLLNGFAMTALAYGGWLGFLTTRWILAGLIMLFASGALYGSAVKRYQNQMAKVSADAVQAGNPLPETFSLAFRKWAQWGTVATILPLIALYFMVAKPGI